MMQIRNIMVSIVILTNAVVLSSCNSIIAEYSLQAYTNATSLKARSLALVDLSEGPYLPHVDVANTLMADINAAFEFANGLPNNQIAARQWDLIRDKERNLVGGYVEFWKTQSPSGVSDFFRNEAKTGIARAFDYVICLEVNKRESSSCTSLSTASQ